MRSRLARDSARLRRPIGLLGDFEEGDLGLDPGVEGEWWLPDHPTRRIPGTLIWDADGLELRLHGALEEFTIPPGEVVRVGAPERVDVPVIHGRSWDGQAWTALGSWGLPLRIPEVIADVEETYRPAVVLAGCHTGADAFTELDCEFEHLDLWAGSPSLLLEHSTGDSAKLRFGSAPLGDAVVDGASIQLISGVVGTYGKDSVALQRTTFFRAVPTEPTDHRSLVRNYVQAFHDLLVLCLGRSVALESVQLQPADHVNTLGRADAYFEYLQSADGHVSRQRDVVGTESAAILTLSTSRITFDVLMSRWLQIWEDARDVVGLLLSPMFAPFTYSEHGYAATFQSAEALHKRFGDNRDVEPSEHKKRVKRVAEALEAAGLSEEDVEWATSVVRSRNDKKLTARIDELLARAGEVGEAVLSADQDFSKTAAGLRGRVSHGGGAQFGTAERRYWYMQVLKWVVRALLLGELLDDQAEISKRVLRNGRFRYALTRLVTVDEGEA